MRAAVADFTAHESAVCGAEPAPSWDAPPAAWQRLYGDGDLAGRVVRCTNADDDPFATAAPELLMLVRVGCADRTAELRAVPADESVGP